jgi:hypothetical protein
MYIDPLLLHLNHQNTVLLHTGKITVITRLTRTITVNTQASIINISAQPFDVGLKSTTKNNAACAAE